MHMNLEKVMMGIIVGLAPLAFRSIADRTGLQITCAAIWMMNASA